MNNKIPAAFPQCVTNNCLETCHEENIIIHDDESINRSCRYAGNPSLLAYPFFTIENLTKKEISILAIDNCILFPSDGQKCDFATFDNKDFYFVELKRALGKSTTKRKKMNESKEQLKATIPIFTHKIDFTTHKIYAVSCVGFSSPRPLANASNLKDKIEFLALNADYQQGNKVSFN